MAGRNPTRREQAVEYFLAHPEARDRDVADALDMDMSTVGRARTKLINEGILPPETRRRNPSPTIDLSGIESVTSSEKPAKTSEKKTVTLDALLTDEDLRALENDNVDDVETRKSILRALRKIAFGRGVNYETAMQAMGLWVKLKDQATSKDLGPGTPMTYAIAKERLKALMTACGFELVFECFQELFVPKDEQPSTESATPVTEG